MTDSQPLDLEKWIGNQVRLHQEPLVRYARSIVGETEAAKDIVQEAFLRLCKQGPQGFTSSDSRAASNLEKPTAAWLFRVCHNLAINRLRKERRMQSNVDGVLEDTQATRTAKDPAAEASEADDHRRLWNCIGELPENQQQVVRLKFHSGMTYREISESTGLSESNVGFLLHKALRSLRLRFVTDPN